MNHVRMWARAGSIDRQFVKDLPGVHPWLPLNKATASASSAWQETMHNKVAIPKLASHGDI